MLAVQAAVQALVVAVLGMVQPVQAAVQVLLVAVAWPVPGVMRLVLSAQPVLEKERPALARCREWV